MDKFKLNDPNTNWKYFLIVIILAFLIGGGILYYQYWWTSQEETGLPEVKKEEFVEVALEELKKGESQIKNIIIGKFKPELLCIPSQCVLFKNKTLIERLPRSHEYELTCDIKNKAKVKIVGWVETLGTVERIGEKSARETVEAGGAIIENGDLIIIDEECRIDGFSIIDKSGNVIDKRGGRGIDEILGFDVETTVKFFDYNDETYFFIHGERFDLPRNLSFLYVVGKEGKIKFITSGPESIDYVLSYKDNLYFHTEQKNIWEIGEDGILRNKFPADKIIIKDSEISFQ